MAETQSKRQRDETQIESEDTKRHKSYNQILSFLDDEDDEPIQDLSEIFTTFQKELNSDPGFDPILDPTHETETICEDFFAVSAACDSSPTSSGLLKEEEEEGSEKEKVIRHLLEASDDELGIPNRMDGGDLDGDVKMNGGDNSFALCDDGLWEIQDEVANYYTLFQSELFM